MLEGYIAKTVGQFSMTKRKREERKGETEREREREREREGEGERELESGKEGPMGWYPSGWRWHKEVGLFASFSTFSGKSEEAVTSRPL